MMFSSAMLLGLLGGNIWTIAIAQSDVIVDAFTMLFAMYNFAVVGVIAIFYQQGVPKWLGQVYLVLTSVIMAWQLGQFPEWSTWALVVVLAFYDLCAVLTPCGPLKWLVNLVQQEGRPLPGTSTVSHTLNGFAHGAFSHVCRMGSDLVLLQVCCTKPKCDVILSSRRERLRTGSTPTWTQRQRL